MNTKENISDQLPNYPELMTAGEFVQAVKELSIKKYDIYLKVGENIARLKGAERTNDGWRVPKQVVIDYVDKHCTEEE